MTRFQTGGGLSKSVRTDSPRPGHRKHGLHGVGTGVDRQQGGGSGGVGLIHGGSHHHHHHHHHHVHHRKGLVTRISPIRGITEPKALDHHVYLPVLLNNVTLTLTALHNEYDTLSAGQFSEAPSGGKHATQLRELPLDTLLMDWQAKWFSVGGQDHRHVGIILERILDWRTPVLLLITRHPHHHGAKPVARMHVTFRSLTREERPGEADTRYVSIDIKQWRNAQAGRRTHHPGKHHLPTTHKLKAGDTLRSLSKHYYGTYRHWRHIRDANGIGHKFGGETPIVRLPGKWKVGHKIKIPRLPAETKTVKSDSVKGHHRGAAVMKVPG